MESLNLRIGDTFQLHVVNDEQKRFVCRLIGYVPGKSMLLTAPVSNGKLALVREGQVFDCRTLSGANVYAFTTQIIKTNLRPYPYIHLKYPKQVEVATARNALRAEVEMPVSVMNVMPGSQRSPATAKIKDLSMTGCMLEHRERLGELDDRLMLALKLKIADTEHTMKLPSILRNVRVIGNSDTAEEVVQHGIQFQIVEGADLLAIHGFVFQHLYESSTMSGYRSG